MNKIQQRKKVRRRVQRVNNFCIRIQIQRVQIQEHLHKIMFLHQIRTQRDRRLKKQKNLILDPQN